MDCLENMYVEVCFDTLVHLLHAIMGIGHYG